MTHDKKQDVGPFTGDGLVGRALRAELDSSFSSSEELPTYYECVRVKEDGKLEITIRAYDGNDKLIGEDETEPGSEKYNDIIGRHGQLKAGQTSMFYRYADGRTELK